MNEIHPLLAYPLAYYALAALLALLALAAWWYTRPENERAAAARSETRGRDYRSETQKFRDRIERYRAAWAGGSIGLRELHLDAARSARSFGSYLQGENYLAATRTQLEGAPGAKEVAAVVALCEAPSFSDREQAHAEALFAALEELAAAQGGQR